MRELFSTRTSGATSTFLRRSPPLSPIIGMMQTDRPSMTDCTSRNIFSLSVIRCVIFRTASSKIFDKLCGRNGKPEEQEKKLEFFNENPRKLGWVPIMAVVSGLSRCAAWNMAVIGRSTCRAPLNGSFEKNRLSIGGGPTTVVAQAEVAAMYTPFVASIFCYGISSLIRGGSGERSKL